VSGEIGGVLSVIDVPGHKVIATIKIDRPDPKPKGIAVHPGGKWVYVANGGSNDVAVIDAERNEVAGYIAVGQRPWGLALTRDGKKLYVANGVANTVSVVDTEARAVTATIRVGQRPWGVAIGP
jgi:YVTN family beta-propeller protein